MTTRLVKHTRIHLILFYAFFSLLSFYFYKDWITVFPRNTHAWTQTDRYAIALNFYEYNSDLFRPTTYNLQCKDGITASDFTIHEYAIAQLMKVFGTSEPVVFRMYSLIYCSIGLFFFYLLVKQLTRSILLGLLAVGLLFTVPVYCYNQAGFIPSVTSFSNFLIALYFLYNSFLEKNNKKYVAAVVFILLAALCRLPYIIFLISLLVQNIFVAVKEKKNGGWFVTAISALIVVGCYQVYIYFLRSKYGTLFLHTPLFIKDIDTLKLVVAEVWNNWLFIYATKYHYFIFLLLVSLVVFYRMESKDKLFGVYTLIASLGVVSYFIINGLQYTAHDYYFIDSFLPLVVLMSVLVLSRISFPKKSIEYIFSGLMVVGFVFAANDCKAFMNERFLLKEENRIDQTSRAYIGSAEYLDKVGVPRDAKLLVIQGYTYNIPFIFMKRKGYTILIAENDFYREKYFEHAFDYVVMPTEYMLQEVICFYPDLMNHLKFVASNGKISVFKYQKENNQQSMAQFIGVDNTTCRKYISSATLNDWKKQTSENTDTAVFTIGSDSEFPLNWKTAMYRIKNKSKLFLLKGLINIEDNAALHFVEVQRRGDEQYYYKGYALNDYAYLRKSKNAWRQFNFIFSPQQDYTDDDEALIYLWNQGKHEFKLKGVEIWEIEVSE